MRPYLAILRDSFREALLSRTLPFLLGFFTLVLLVLAPISLEEDVPWRLSFEEIADQRLWLVKLRVESQEEGDNPGKRVLERLSADAKAHLGLGGEAAAAEAEGASGAFVLTSSINRDVLPDRTLYDAAAWEDVRLDDEARALLERGPERLSEREVGRLNRLLLSAAYPGVLRPPPESRVRITYLGFEISGFMEQFVADSELMRRIVRELIYVICVWGIGPIGLFVAILVTAEIMPRTFEPGAIDLLLSKPISRTLMFLTKFVGACAFVLISFSYLVIGLWLIFWLRLDAWAPQLFAAIPLFMFSFAVIYAISAVTGLRWRSPIVSVMLTVVIWGLAFLLGLTRDAMTNLRAEDRVRQITPAGQTLIAADFGRTAYLWSDESNDWFERTDIVPPLGSRAVNSPLFLPKVVGPLYDPVHKQIISAELGALGDNVLHVGAEQTNWRTKAGAPLPPGTIDVMMDREGRLYAIGQAGLFEFRGDPSVQKKEFKIFGLLDLAPEDTVNAFMRVDEDMPRLSDSAAADLDDEGKTVAVYDQGLVFILNRQDEGEFRKKAERRLFKSAEAPPAIVAVAGELIALGLKDGTIRLLDLETLEDVSSSQPFGEELPRTAAVSADGRWIAVLFHGGQLWTFDTENRNSLGKVPGHGDISAVAFDREGRLLVADRLRRVTRVNLPDLSIEKRYSGSLPFAEKLYRFALVPISYVLPDTYGLRSVYQYLFTELKSESMTGNEDDLESQRIQLDLRRPIVQNLAFLAVVLGLASLYISRKDF